MTYTREDQKLFKVWYEFRRLGTVERDRALVVASGKAEAKAKLIDYVKSVDPVVVITVIFKITEYEGDVITHKFGMN